MITLFEPLATNIKGFSGRTWLLPLILDWYDNRAEPLVLCGSGTQRCRNGGGVAQR